MMPAPLFSIILPVYNQADHISPVVEGYAHALNTLPIAYELILSVNGSRDASHTVCLDLARRIPRIRVIHSVAGGWGLGVRNGLAAATGDFVCYTNSARTTGAMLARVVAEALKTPDAVIKARRIERQSLLRRTGSMLYNTEVKLLFGGNVHDVNGTPKCFPRRFGELLALQENGDLLDAEFIALCIKNKRPVLTVDMPDSARSGGKSTTNLRSAAKMLLGVWRLWLRLRNAPCA